MCEKWFFDEHIVAKLNRSVTLPCAVAFTRWKFALVWPRSEICDVMRYMCVQVHDETYLWQNSFSGRVKMGHQSMFIMFNYIYIYIWFTETKWKHSYIHFSQASIDVYSLLFSMSISCRTPSSCHWLLLADWQRLRLVGRPWSLECILWCERLFCSACCI